MHWFLQLSFPQFLQLPYFAACGASLVACWVKSMRTETPHLGWFITAILTCAIGEVIPYVFHVPSLF